MADNETKLKLLTFLLLTKRNTEEQSEAIIRFAEDSLDTTCILLLLYL